MLPLNDYTLLKDYELNKLPVILAGAEEHRLLSEAGLIRRPSPRAPLLWLSCQVCRSLWRLGQLLVKAGQRLEQRYAPMTLSRASEPT
jgi:hypothetical protein